MGAHASKPAVTPIRSPAAGCPDLAVTPLVPLDLGRGVVWCKLEHLNPSGSVKDRITTFMVERALERGEVPAGGLVVEASSGSTAVSLAMVCARRGLRFAAFMPVGVSRERVVAIRGFGGEVHLTPPAEGMGGTLASASSFALAQGGFCTRQFENPDNIEAHRTTTARQLAEQAPEGRIDAFVSGVGTGGTLMGVALGLAELGSPASAVAARPTTRSPGGVGCGCFVAAEQCSFSARIPGVLDGVSALYQPERVPGGVRVVEVDEHDAIDAMRRLLHAGYPVGPSSGLNFAAGERIAAELGPGAVVATILCDRVERYFSTELFDGFCEATPAG